MLALTKQITMQTVLEWPQSHATRKTINMITNKYEPQQKCRLGTVSKNTGGGGLKPFNIEPDILSRIAYSTKPAAPSRLKIIWRNESIPLDMKAKLIRILILSTFLCACGTCALIAVPERRMQEHQPTSEHFLQTPYDV